MTQSRSEFQEIESLELDCDVAIVGGGIIGATLACALSESGLQVILIESQVGSIAAAKGQAYAFSILSSRIFQGLGLWDDVAPRISACTEIRLSDADYPETVQFTPADLGTETLVYVAEHAVLLEVLQHRLRQSAQVRYLCPAQVQAVHYGDEGAVVQAVQGGSPIVLRSRLVVAADGSRSQTRAAAGIKTHGWPYWQSCIVCCVQPERPATHIAHERFQPSGPFAILPLPDGVCRIVWTAPHADAHALCALPDEQFLTELTHRFGDHMGRLSLVGGRYVFPVQLMQSDRYIGQRLALVGDAAHGCHPVGGQGLNMGIRDAAALAQVLQEAHQQGQDIGTVSVLRQYERWRRWENLWILAFTDFLDRCFSSQWPPVIGLRRRGLWLLNHVQPVRRLALRLMTGLMGRSPRLAQPDR
ncbi:FAD-dependent hydroxylase [Leptolyngbya sp. 'hensonii']|uniref:FAD-dependent hydroxylase n=1 Tax=Leptolyngbya sp. 'hensonii' TaxID=1922337 RepID=UPI00209A7CEC|nr:FAD-dependent hydroxylase [Leptolyngbya sp. 'hensonii']